ncbi:hypothetical protein CLG96_09955 [Sphingomonas oleivorans]|uniref:Uncharacterized protein n=1 Tax=Sphingomonas oleivorans TaxID=1735121 RepID=A0A2T5FX62_9SPHN|nr:M23 family metallopeptidase [Sphingomonas oleivorans]PTQ10725.1 hypothetical protein CLG96_09955 [Sphingomonas oleivorans]
MYLRNEHELGIGGGAVALGRDSSLATGSFRAVDRAGVLRRHLDRLSDLDLIVDLGARIGSREWLRGLVTFGLLCASAIALAPGFEPFAVPAEAPLREAQWQEARAQAISPLAYGADSGRRMASTAIVERLADTPERPSIDVNATLGRGDGFARVLERNGVGAKQAAEAASLVSGAVGLGEIKSGTRMNLTLGRRASRSESRPLDRLAFRAKFDLSLVVERVGGALRLVRIPIAVDNTPLRIQGRVGSSLFQSARNAGAPAGAVEAYLRALGQRMSVRRDVKSGDRFDIIVEQRRAATGEVEIGQLLFAGLDQGSRKTRLLKWTSGGRDQWFEASGVGETRGLMRVPVVGRLTSSFGMRRHPLLGYSRFHKGQDYGAPTGAPIVAATDGVVAFAGWHGGHGNFVKLTHAGGLATAYGHMSRIAARAGQRVSAGQVIGYVGSTGLSTGPHLHYEVYKNGVAINPGTIKFTTAAQLAGAELRKFRATLARLMGVRVGAGAAVQSAEAKDAKPEKKG